MINSMWGAASQTGVRTSVYRSTMPTETATKRSAGRRKNGKAPRETVRETDGREANGRENSRRETERFEQRLQEILEHATNVFYAKGYDAASMRDLSRASGMSLAGLYYYFESKERLLYLIQKHTFETVIRNLKSRLELVNDAEERVRVFIQNHLEYFLANRKAMTVLSHEDETLQNDFGTEILGLKREYYRIGVQLVDELRASQTKRFANVNSRIAVLSLFGMVNWIYTWHNPRIDADATDLARQMSQIFLNGVLQGETPKLDSESKLTGRKRRAGT
jgi:AcrR family transcriptional regulator